MRTTRIVRISYFTMLTVIGALFHLPFFGTPVDFTLQTLFVVASGMLLGAVDGALSQALYVVIGLLGLPVFTRGGGFSYVFEPTFGYILSFPFAAFLAGKLVRKKSLSPVRLFLCAFASLTLIYAVGIPYQLVIFLFREKYTLSAAWATVPSVLIMYGIDTVLILLFCLIYPRAKSLIGRLDQIATPIGNAQNLPPDEEEEEKKGEKNPAPEPAGMRRFGSPTRMTHKPDER